MCRGRGIAGRGMRVSCRGRWKGSVLLFADGRSAGTRLSWHSLIIIIKNRAHSKAASLSLSINPCNSLLRISTASNYPASRLASSLADWHSWFNCLNWPMMRVRVSLA